MGGVYLFPTNDEICVSGTVFQVHFTDCISWQVESRHASNHWPCQNSFENWNELKNYWSLFKKKWSENLQVYSRSNAWPNIFLWNLIIAIFELHKFSLSTEKKVKCFISCGLLPSNANAVSWAGLTLFWLLMISSSLLPCVLFIRFNLFPFLSDSLNFQGEISFAVL